MTTLEPYIHRMLPLVAKITSSPSPALRVPSFLKNAKFTRLNRIAAQSASIFENRGRRGYTAVIMAKSFCCFRNGVVVLTQNNPTACADCEGHLNVKEISLSTREDQQVCASLKDRHGFFSRYWPDVAALKGLHVCVHRGAALGQGGYRTRADDRKRAEKSSSYGGGNHCHPYSHKLAARSADFARAKKILKC